MHLWILWQLSSDTEVILSCVTGYNNEREICFIQDTRWLEFEVEITKFQKRSKKQQDARYEKCAVSPFLSLSSDGQASTQQSITFLHVSRSSKLLGEWHSTQASASPVSLLQLGARSFPSPATYSTGFRKYHLTRVNGFVSCVLQLFNPFGSKTRTNNKLNRDLQILRRVRQRVRVFVQY